MSSPYNVVLANGCWDLFHYGHLLHLEAAAEMGGALIVSITSDRFVNKGPGRPVYPQEHRARIVESLRCVDGVIIVDNLIEAMTLIRPDILVKGQDYKRGLDQEHQDFCRQNGIEIRYTETPKYSASQFLDASRALQLDKRL